MIPINKSTSESKLKPEFKERMMQRDFNDLLHRSLHPTTKHYDGTVFTVGQMSGVYPMPVPLGVGRIMFGGKNITIGPEEHHFLFFCDTKMYLGNILADPEAKERLLNATFEVADMKDYLKDMVVGEFTYIGKVKEVEKCN